jgi:hypothetical protein
MAAGERAGLHAPRATLRGERRFWSGMAIGLVLVAVVGFAPSYYLKSRFTVGPELTPLLRLHGAVMTAWLVLLVTQTSFIAARRVTWHRRLGIVGCFLAAALIVLAAYTGIQRARDGLLGEGMVPPLQFLAIPMMSILVLPLLIGAAIYFRKRSDYHKRLIILASVEFVSPATARLAILAGSSPLLGLLLVDLFTVAMVVRDLVTLRRVHPATLWGGLLILISQPLRFMISGTQPWLAFAAWLTG